MTMNGDIQPALLIWLKEYQILFNFKLPPMKTIHYIDEDEIKNQRVLARVDFDVSLNPDHSIANDVRIKQNLPTLKYLLKITID